MTDVLEERVIGIVQDALRSSADDPHLVIDASDSMETVACWDSLTFMTVFLAVNETFGLDPDFDEAVHYIAVPSLVSFVREQLS